MVGAKRGCSGPLPSRRPSAGETPAVRPVAGTNGSAASNAWMPAAADCPTMPWCKTARRSRNGRNTSVPAISTISSASIVITPSATRHTPSANAAAAPIAMPQSVMPRVITLVERTRIVESDNCRARSASRRP